MTKLIKSTDIIYRNRFNEKEKEFKIKFWKILCNDYFQKYIPKDSSVIDLAAGHCHFINNIQAKARYAVDLNKDTREFADKSVKVYIQSVTKLPKELTNKIDVAFSGCLLEHLASKDEIFKLFQEVNRILKPGGKYIILNPNIRLSTNDYWDYFDHLTPISDRSAVEGLELAGFSIEKVIPGFLPNTVKDKLPKSPLLVKIYLKFPFLYRIFGRQMFIVARKPSNS